MVARDVVQVAIGQRVEMVIANEVNPFAVFNGVGENAPLSNLGATSHLTRFFHAIDLSIFEDECQ